jgi:hypothetical protein
MTPRNIIGLSAALLRRPSITLAVAACCSFALSLWWYFTYFTELNAYSVAAYYPGRGDIPCFFYTTVPCSEIAQDPHIQSVVFAPYLTWLGLLCSILAVLTRGGPARTGSRLAALAAALFLTFAAVAAAAAVTSILLLQHAPGDYPLSARFDDDTLTGLFFFAILLNAGLATFYRWRWWYPSSLVVAWLMVLVMGAFAAFMGSLEPGVVAGAFVFVLWAIRQARKQA